MYLFISQPLISYAIHHTSFALVKQMDTEIGSKEPLNTFYKIPEAYKD